MFITIVITAGTLGITDMDMDMGAIMGLVMDLDI